MLIDMSAYVGHWPFRNLRGNTLDALLTRMNKFGVDKAVVSNLNGIFYVDCQIANEELHNEILSDASFKDRFLPFAVINPVLPWWEDSLKISREKYGMKGIRIYPMYHHYKLTDERCVKMVEAARNTDLPVAIALRMTDLRERSWLDADKALNYNDIADLVKMVPDAKYMVLDARVTDDQQPTTKASIEVLKKADILFDTSRGSGTPVKGPNSESLHYLLDNFGPERVAFGTETPFVDYCSPFFRFGVCEADEKSKQQMGYGNIKRMLNI
jgi:predicted TIM-barrel fold metal-dependent hydrolase